MPEFNIIAEYIPSRTITAQFIPVNFDIPAKLVEKTIQANGVYNASEDNVDGYSSVTVVVPDRPLMVQELNVTPSTESQTINIVSGIDGYGPVNVAAVTGAIDSNIQPSNIKEGVSILGVDGSVVESNETTLSVTPTTSVQSLTPSSPYTGFNEVSVSAVTSSVDANIQPENIRENVTILGTTGTAYIPEHFVDFTLKNGTLTKDAKMINLSGVKTIGRSSLMYLYEGCAFPANTHIDMSDISSIGFSGCSHMFEGAQNTISVDLSNVSVLSANNAALYMFSSNTSLISADLSALDSITGASSTSYMFNGCTSLTTVNLSALKIINAMYAAEYMFQNCTSLQTIDLDSLVAIWNSVSAQQMFGGCTSLTNVNLRHLVTIGGGTQMFQNCKSLTNMNLPSLLYVSYTRACSQMFSGCTALQTVSFPSITKNSFTGYSRTDQWYNMLSGITGCTIHLPKNLDPQTGSTVISSLQSYPNFGGTNTVLAFDLPSTVILTGADTVEYERNPAYDTETALAWRVKFTGSTISTDRDWTPYYTNGTSDPQVGATIYSDSACTQTVTTIGAIA